MYKENVIIKDWRHIDLSFGLVYPNIYKIGMSSYAIRLLYFLINSYNNFVCERIFLPNNIKFPAINDYSSEQQLRSIENKVHPSHFDVLGFSLQFENDFRNVLWILEKAGIPLTYKERLESLNNGENRYPFIIGGGPAVTSNPMPLSKIFDFFFIGDSEMILGLVLKLILNYKSKKIKYQDFLNEIKKIKGIFIPLLNNKVKRAVLDNLDDSPIPDFQLLSKTSQENAIFVENFFIEVNRGCPFQCKFCISSFHNFPFRNRSFKNIIKSIERGIKYSDFETISLIGSCVSAHPKFYEICKFILNKGKRLTIPSIRIEHLTPDIIQILERGNIKTITIAPESGSERLRYELGKKISNDKIFSVLKAIKESNIKNVKMYFLIGLPDETEDDINNTIKFLKIVSDIGFERNSLKINVNPFIPKLNTPYEKKIDFYLKENFDSFKLKFKKFEKELKNISSIKLKFQNPKNIMNNAKLQTLLSLGDEGVSDLLINYYLHGATFGALRRAEKDLNFSLDNHLLKIKESYTPWRFIP
jgi:radical SAM superfamily enzyme YgiQ (UPF0313 family)